VADALTTAFLLISPGEIQALCERSPGVEAWILAEPTDNGDPEATLLHFGGSRPGYTSAWS
jgi:thiamine biosynthesis lipoprotein ApbE